MSSQNEALSATAYAGNVLTILGGLFLISNYIVLHVVKKKQSNVHQRLLLTYAVVQLILSAGGILFNVLDHTASRTVCVMQALHITFWNLASWFWSSIIAFNIFLLIQPELKFKVPDRLSSIPLDLPYHLVGWGIPIILICIVAGFHSSLVDTGAWCWIGADKPGLRVGAFYGWSILSSLFNIVILALIATVLINKARAVNNDKTNRLAVRLGARMALYVVVFVLCWIFGTVVRIGEIIRPGFYNFPLLWIHTFLSISTGFWISVIAGYVEKLYEGYWSLCCRKGEAKGQDNFVFSEDEHRKTKSAERHQGEVAIPMEEKEDTPAESIVEGDVVQV